MQDISNVNQTPVTDVGKVAEERREIEIHVLKNANQSQCSFWLGLYRPGSLQTEDIVGLKSVKDILHQVATLGLQSEGSVLLSTIENMETRYVFLISVNDSDEVLPKAYWMSNLTKALQGLQAKEIGCYIPRELDVTKPEHELLEELVLNLIFSTNINKYFLLSGEHGINPVLNLALSLKQDFKINQNIKTTVYH